MHLDCHDHDELSSNFSHGGALYSNIMIIINENNALDLCQWVSNDGDMTKWAIKRDDGDRT